MFEMNVNVIVTNWVASITNINVSIASRLQWDSKLVR